MAIVSSHLLSSTDGSHATGVKVIIKQINKNGTRRKIFQSKTDKNGRIYKQFSLTRKDTSLKYEIIFNIQNILFTYLIILLILLIFLYQIFLLLFSHLQRRLVWLLHL